VFLHLVAEMSDKFLEQRFNCFFVKLGKNASDTSTVLSEAYVREAVKKPEVFFSGINDSKRVAC
jgi:hypothetical protein